MAKYFWAEMSVDVTDDVLQIHGGAGYVTDHRAEGFYCDE
jgi:alkylation response protein AidB-like acyl-CoA dehydrogenase